jgi:hypothetical protein
MKFFAITAALFTFAYGLDCKLEDGWKGIKVLQTSRSQVEQLLGKPVEVGNVYTRYKMDDEIINIRFAIEGGCKSVSKLGGWDVEEGTVLDYFVVPKSEVRLGELKWDRSGYSRVEDTHQLGFIYYKHVSASIRLTSIKRDDHELVRTIEFWPTSEQMQKFKCHG